jgi:hypothetical protein
MSSRYARSASLTWSVLIVCIDATHFAAIAAALAASWPCDLALTNAAAQTILSPDIMVSCSPAMAVALPLRVAASYAGERSP